MSRRKVLAVLIVLVLVFSFFQAGCKKNAASGNTFNFRILADPVSLDPAQAGDMDSMQVVTQVFDGLVDYDAVTAKVIPAVAGSWEMDDSATLFTFHLKDNVKFQNGRTVKASDFKYAWERVVSPATASPMAYLFEQIDGYKEVQDKKSKVLSGVTAVDDTTLKVKLSKPFADFIMTLGHPVFSPVPREEADADPKKFGLKPVGNGPFKVKSWARGNKIVTEKYDGYYGKKPLLNEVVYKVLGDDNTALIQFKAGDIEFTYIPTGQVEVLKKDSSYKVDISPMLATYYFCFDLAKEPWSKVKVRQAFSCAIDKKAIVDKYAEGAASSATGIVPKGMPGFQANAGSYSYNPEKAKKLLLQSGFPGGKGFPKETLYFEQGLGHDVVAQIIQQNLKDIGVTIELRGLEPGAFDNLVAEKKATFYRQGWGADFPSPDAFLTPLFSSTSQSNSTGYKNTAFDAKLIQAKSTTDQQTRLKLYQEAEKMVMADAPVVPVLFQTNRNVIHKNVKGLVFSPLGFVDMRDVSLE